MRSTILASLSLALLFPTTVHAQVPGTSPITRTELHRHALGAGNREAIQVRIDFAVGASFPRHSHPGEEVIYVLSGSLRYDVEGQPSVTLSAGDVLFIPAGAVHAAANTGSDPGAELATYIVDPGKPLVKLAD
jgi:quercetin dioxygenase-like cupin family protein